MSSAANVSSSSVCASACEWPGAGFAREGDLPLAVQAIDRRRAGALVGGDEVAELHQLAAPGPDGRGGDRVRRAAERVLRLEHDVVLIRRRVERRHLLARDQGVDGLRDVLDADAEVGGALPVDVEAQLGTARQVRPIDVDEDLTLVERLHRLARVLVELLQIGADQRVLNHGPAAAHDLEAAGSLHGDSCGLPVRLDQPARARDQLLLRDVALVDRLQPDRHVAAVALALGAAAAAEPRDRQRVGDAGQLLRGCRARSDPAATASTRGSSRPAAAP